MAALTSYVIDHSVERHGNVVVGGSPSRLFRLSTAGAAAFERIVSGTPTGTSRLLERFIDAGVVHPVPSSGAYTTDDITVVVPTLGEPRHVPPGAIVVDDGSMPPVSRASIRLPTNQGPAAARMAGLSRVTTPLVAFVDADVALPEGALELLAAHFTDERVGLVAPRVRGRPGSSWFERYDSEHSPLDLGGEPARISAGTRVSYVPAAAILVRVDAIRAIGGFDTALRYGEDVDLVWRLDEAGWRCRYDPRIIALHDARPTWQAWVAQRIGYGSSAAALAKRHPGALAPARMNGWTAATWGLLTIGHPVAGLAVGAGSTAALTVKLRDVPPTASIKIAGLGTLMAGRNLLEAVRRVWWPIIALAALCSSRARWIALAAAVDAGHPIKIADDAAYGIGVWRGMWRDRTLEPLRPDITSWPPRPGVRGRVRTLAAKLIGRADTVSA